jgi:hypothetical protein
MISLPKHFDREHQQVEQSINEDSNPKAVMRARTSFLRSLLVRYCERTRDPSQARFTTRIIELSHVLNGTLCYHMSYWCGCQAFCQPGGFGNGGKLTPRADICWGEVS